MSRNRPRGPPTNRDNGIAANEETDMWNKIIQDVRRAKEKNDKQKVLAEQIAVLNEKIGREGSKPTLAEISQLDGWYRQVLKLSEEEKAILQEEPSDVIKNLGLLTALRSASEAETSASRAASLPKSSKPSTNARDGAAVHAHSSVHSPVYSPAPAAAASNSALSDKLNRVKGSTQRSSSVSSSGHARDARDTVPVKVEEGAEGTKATAGERGGPFTVGAQVVYKHRNKQGVEGEGIQCIIKNVTGDGPKARYDVQDPEPNENGEPGAVYKTTANYLIPIPAKDAPLPSFSVGKQVLARYPDTTTFYRAEVMGAKKDVYRLKFEGEEDDKEMEVDRRLLSPLARCIISGPSIDGFLTSYLSSDSMPATMAGESSPFIAPQPLRSNAPMESFGLDAAEDRHDSTESNLQQNLHHRDILRRAFDNDHDNQHSTASNDGTITSTTPALPESIISPAFTPPSTPGGTLIVPEGSALNADDLSQRVSHSATTTTTAKGPKLLERLPNVECVVRARIPTTTGAEMFLHLYQNDADNKEHLAIVFGNHIRSRSLDRVQEGETEMDRMIRGAYVGRLHPGRVSSRLDTSSGSGSESTNDRTRNDGLDAPREAPLVRIHSECYTGETAWSARCDCGEQLDEAARLMSMASEPASTSEHSHGENKGEEGGPVAPSSRKVDGPGGVIIYLRQEGRGIGLGEKLKAYNLQDLGSDTVEANLLLRHPADARSYGLATAMLVDLGLGADAYPEGIRLLTNNPDKIRAVEGPNREVRVKERVAMVPIAWRTGGQKGIRSTEIEGYLQTKIGKMGHMIR